MLNVNFTLPHWHDPFHFSPGLLGSVSEVMMGNWRHRRRREAQSV